MVPLPQLQPFLLDPDRAIRERAFRLVNAPYLASLDALSAIFDRMYELRQQVARNAGFRDFRDYSFRVKCRFDYTPDEVERFHAAVEAESPRPWRGRPEAEGRLGLPEVRPWDTTVDPYGSEALVPFRDARELEAKALAAARRMDPTLGGEFEVLVREGMLDLDSRKGKAPGGYCETLHYRGRPFIFMNAAGTLDDVTTLFHEAGHAFHAFAAHPLPLIWQRHPGMEAAELASMSMELLAMPLLGRTRWRFLRERGCRPRAGRAPRGHPGDAWPTSPRWTRSRRWIYTSGEGHDAEARDRAWPGIRERFERGVDWSGLERGAGRPMVPPAAHLPLSVLLHRVRDRPVGRAPGLAQQPRVSERGARPPIGAALALGATAPCPRSTGPPGRRMVFDPGRHGRAGGAAGEADRAAARAAQLARLSRTPPLRPRLRPCPGDSRRTLTRTGVPDGEGRRNRDGRRGDRSPARTGTTGSCWRTGTPSWPTPPAR